MNPNAQSAHPGDPDGTADGLAPSLSQIPELADPVDDGWEQLVPTDGGRTCPTGSH